MSQDSLFPLPPAEQPTMAQASGRLGARVNLPRRGQVEWQPRSLDSLVAPDHLVRTIWDLLDGLNLDAFYARIKAALDRPGRPASDPKVLLSLWVYACAENIGSARQLARLCEEHDAFRWLCGGVPVNHHLLSDFRIANRTAMDDLLTQILAGLKQAGAVALEYVSQDGVRVRASAAAPSFRRKDSLEQYYKEARAQVERLGRLRKQSDPGRSRKQQSAQERAAQERLERVKQALLRLPELEAIKEEQKHRLAKERRERVGEARVSTTDPEASVMKMAGGGFRPAYNLQFATDNHSGIIVGVSVTNSGSDAHQAPDMAEQIVRRLGQQPVNYLMDGGFAVREDITRMARSGVTVYAPVRSPKSRPEAERYQPRYGDSAEVIAWRGRMATETGKAIYRRRAVAEWTNAQVSQHGMGQFNVRGLAKVLCVGILLAITHNLLRWTKLT